MTKTIEKAILVFGRESNTLYQSQHINKNGVSIKQEGRIRIGSL